MVTELEVFNFLRKNNVPFEVVDKKGRGGLRSFQTVRVALAKIKGKESMFIIPAGHRLDALKVCDALDTEEVQIEEIEFEDLALDWEKDVLVPFGPLYKMPCYVDVSLEDQKEVFFKAGNYKKESIKISISDFLRLAEGEIGDYSVPAHCAMTSDCQGEDAIDYID